MFNKCTSDNNGDTIPIEEEEGEEGGGGTEVVTQDSPKFKVTFNYEFLEDFREVKTQEVQIRSTNSRRQKFQSEGGLYTDREALTEGDEVDGGFFQSAIRRTVIAPDRNMENSWGPEGFTKSNHPLNIMVCVKHFAIILYYNLKSPLVGSIILAIPISG